MEIGKQTPAEKLVGIIGDPQTKTGQVRRAHKELLRKLGGTRRETIRNVRFQGVALIAVALTAGLAGIFISSFLQTSGEYFFLLTAVLVIAASSAILGLLLIILPPGHLPKLSILLGQRAKRVMTSDPPPEELIKNLKTGTTKDRAPTIDIIRDRLDQERDQREKRLNRWGWLAAGLGLWLALFSAFALGALYLDSAFQNTVAREWGSLTQLQLKTLVVTTVSIGIYGIAFLVAAMGLYRKGNWAKKMLVELPWLWLGSAAAVVPLPILGLFISKEVPFGPEIAGVLVIFNLAIWAIVLRRIINPLQSPDLARWTGELGDMKEGSGKMGTVLWLFCAAVLLTNVVLPFATYCFYSQHSTRGLKTQLQEMQLSGTREDCLVCRPEKTISNDAGLSVFRRASEKLHAIEPKIIAVELPSGSAPGGKKIEHWDDLLLLSSWEEAQLECAAKIAEIANGPLRSFEKLGNYPPLCFGWNYHSGSKMRLPQLHTLNQAVKLACISAMSNASRGKFDIALRNVQTALKLARHPADPILTVQMARILHLRLACRALEPCLSPQAVPADELGAVQALLSDAQAGLSLREAFRCERVFIAASWEDLRTGNWIPFNRRKAPLLAATVLEPLLASRLNAGIRIAKRAEALARYKNRDLLASMEELQFELQRVRTARGWGQIAQHLAPDPIRFLPDYFAIAVRFTSCRALTGAVGIGIALRRYGDENEKTITNLDCLKQKYLDKIPIDPFKGEPYRLRRRHNGTIVYSVGRNLRDDHGKIQAAVPGFPPPDIGVFLEDQ